MLTDEELQQQLIKVHSQVMDLYAKMQDTVWRKGPNEKLTWKEKELNQAYKDARAEEERLRKLIDGD